MKVYLVGGAVRDALLGRAVKDRDWCVVGASPAQMIAEGYRPVGRDFPVFLHPHTGEEYALARTERRHGRGHGGFLFDTGVTVTLEEDLVRRDLTINAMARTPDGDLVDPYEGREDLAQGILRHVGPAFAEDPLRVLRVARFAARYDDFTVATETRRLMTDMTVAGELKDLTPERVWAETAKALMADRPSRYFDTLRQCGALRTLFPELSALAGVPQPEAHHPEVDTYVHVMMALDKAAELGANLRTRFAVLLHDLGKGLTDPAAWPRHIGHESRGVYLVDALCHRLRVPSRCRDLARTVTDHHTRCHQALVMRPKKLVKLITSVNGYQDPELLDDFLLACEADARGRLNKEDEPYPQAGLVRMAADASRGVRGRDFIQQGHPPGEKIAELINAARARQVRQAVNEFLANEARDAQDLDASESPAP